MKKVVAVIMLLTIIVAFAGAQETHYAYRVFQLSPSELQKILDSQGADGFHLVSIIWMQPFFLVVMEHPY